MDALNRLEGESFFESFSVSVVVPSLFTVQAAYSVVILAGVVNTFVSGQMHIGSDGAFLCLAQDMRLQWN